jgi:tRNA threonylcarbamoyladenosine biosynthesis protein TsaB
MIDARRMEVYSAIYDRSLKEIRGIQADIVDADTYSEYLERGPVVFFGNGSSKCKEVISHPNAIFIDDIHPLASNAAPLAEMRLRKGETVSIAYFEPFYLKEFQATKPKNLL